MIALDKVAHLLGGAVIALACPAYLHGFEIDGKTVDFTNALQPTV